MKKLIVFILAAAMAVGLGGTALAQSTVELNIDDSGVSYVYDSAAFATADGGASAFVVGGFGIVPTTTNATATSGTTLYAISNDKSNGDGTAMRRMALTAFDTSLAGSGATAIGGPQLLSGTSDTIILYVMGGPELTVGDGVDTGGTLYSINGGTGAAYWARPIAASGFRLNGSEADLYSTNASGVTMIPTAPVTIDNESIETSGATIFGVSGATWFGGNQDNTRDGTTGVSLWAVASGDGSYATSSAGNSSVTAFSIYDSYTGISVVHAAPVVSGTSLFIVGYSQAYSAVTIYQFVKNDLLAGVSASALVMGSADADLSDQWTPTPAVSGDSIFVVDNNGMVTSFYKANLSQNYSVNYSQNDNDSGVSAGPVTDGKYIVLCSTSAVTNYLLDNLSGNSKQWTYDFGNNASIWATPVISGDASGDSGASTFVWVTVNDTVASSSSTYRFDLTDETDGDPTLVSAHGKLVYASPIVVDTDVWTITWNPTVEKHDANGSASGATYWPQHKFGPEKAGANVFTASTTADAAAEDTNVADAGGSSGGCFISTIK